MDHLELEPAVDRPLLSWNGWAAGRLTGLGSRLVVDTATQRSPNLVGILSVPTSLLAEINSMEFSMFRLFIMFNRLKNDAHRRSVKQLR
jgi:hypothetical protein